MDIYQLGTYAFKRLKSFKRLVKLIKQNENENILFIINPASLKRLFKTFSRLDYVSALSCVSKPVTQQYYLLGDVFDHFKRSGLHFLKLQ